MSQRLLEILAPPAQPLEVPTAAQWADFESRWHRVPPDFKDFVTVYGTGSINDFIEVFNPASSNQSMNLSARAESTLSVLREFRRPGLKLFPEPGGIFPIAATANGDMIAWETLGIPEKWRIVVVDARSSEKQTFDMCFTGFISAILDRQVKCKIFPDSFPKKAPFFNQAGSG